MRFLSGFFFRKSRLLTSPALFCPSRVTYRGRTSAPLTVAFSQLSGRQTTSFSLSSPVRFSFPLSPSPAFIDACRSPTSPAGDNLLLLLTRTFDPLSESPLHTTSFGSDAPVSVGWGHKTTQFHGSLGKDAAAEAARAKPMEVDWILSENDDERTRVRWRGDSAWFAVSSVEEAPPKEVLSEGEEAKDRRVRRIRIFSRMGEHSSTSEPVPGLEGSLAWCPTGEMIASTQRRELPGVEGAEKEVDLRVVFFERNGLRRYEFPIVAGRDELREGRVKVRELGWNSGSDVLAVWVEKTGAEGGKEDSSASSLSFVLRIACLG